MNIRRKLLFVLLTGLLVSACVQQHPSQPKITLIFETDLGNDVDDALAMDMLYKYVRRGDVKLLGVSLNKNGVAPIEYADILNTWYGCPDVPIAAVRNGAECEEDAVNYASAVCGMRNEDETPVFARTLGSYSDIPEASQWYRKVLAAAEDNSVDIVSVGFSTNLVRLLGSGPDECSPLSGKELIARKVRTLVMMAGCFNDPAMAEYNVRKDIPAAKAIFGEWPSAIVTSPFEVGIQIRYPGSSIENDFGWVAHHPVVEAYKSYLPMPYDRPTWDLTALLYAVEGADWFTLSPAGNITVTDDGHTIFTADENGNRRYLSVDSTQSEAILNHFVEMITADPEGYK